jgi:hypothetical protein
MGDHSFQKAYTKLGSFCEVIFVDSEGKSIGMGFHNCAN